MMHFYVSGAYFVNVMPIFMYSVHKRWGVLLLKSNKKALIFPCNCQKNKGFEYE